MDFSNVIYRDLKFRIKTPANTQKILMDGLITVLCISLNLIAILWLRSPMPLVLRVTKPPPLKIRYSDNTILSCALRKSLVPPVLDLVADNKNSSYLWLNFIRDMDLFTRQKH